MVCWTHHMESFPTTLLKSPLKSHLVTLLTAATGMIGNHLIGQTGTVQLPATIATDIMLGVAGLLFAVLGVAYSYWKRCQPMELIEWAKKQGRIICECTEVGTVMVMCDRERSGASLKVYECKVCKEIRVVRWEIPIK